MNVEFFVEKKYEGLIPEPYSSFKKTPEWYKKTDNINRSKCPFFNGVENIQNILKKTNIKSCPAINDCLNTGYIIPAWTNFLFREVDGNLYINWEHGFASEYAAHHKDLHFNGMDDKESPEYNVFNKLGSPWFIKTSPGISCLITHPFWDREKRFTTVSGVVHTDVSPIELKWFFEINLKLNDHIDVKDMTEGIVVSKGTPIIQIIPFVRKEFNSNVRYVDSDFYRSEMMEKSTYTLRDWFNKSPYNNFRESLGKLFK